MSRPAKPARQTWHARRTYRPASGSNARGNLGYRACLVCRASFAGRGMALARATRLRMLAVPLRPKTQSWVGYATAECSGTTGRDTGDSSSQTPVASESKVWPMPNTQTSYGSLTVSEPVGYWRSRGTVDSQSVRRPDSFAATMAAYQAA